LDHSSWKVQSGELFKRGQKLNLKEDAMVGKEWFESNIRSLELYGLYIVAVLVTLAAAVILTFWYPGHWLAAIILLAVFFLLTVPLLMEITISKESFLARGHQPWLYRFYVVVLILIWIGVFLAGAFMAPYHSPKRFILFISAVFLGGVIWRSFRKPQS
jgi:uncharacterized membrane protein